MSEARALDQSSDECQHEWTPWVYRRGDQLQPDGRFKVVHDMDRTCRKCRCNQFVRAGT